MLCPNHIRSAHWWYAYKGEWRDQVNGCKVCGTAEFLQDLQRGAYIVGQDPRDGISMRKDYKRLQSLQNRILSDKKKNHDRAVELLLQAHQEELESTLSVLEEKSMRKIMVKLHRAGKLDLLDYL